MLTLPSRQLAMSGRRSSLLTDLVAYWKLEEASGNRADSLGFSNLAPTNTPGNAAGKQGNGLSLVAASSQYLSVASNSNLVLGDFDFTVAGWVNLTTVTGSSKSGIAKWNTTALSKEFSVGYYNTGVTKFQFYISGNGVTAASVSAGTPNPAVAGTWYFVLSYHDAASNVIGISVDNATATTAAHTTGCYVGSSALNLGTIADPLGEYGNGVYDEFGIWKRLLTATEKSALYNGGFGTTYPF